MNFSNLQRHRAAMTLLLMLLTMTGQTARAQDFTPDLSSITIEGVQESYTVTRWSNPTVDYIVKDANGQELTYSTHYTATLTNGDGTFSFAPGYVINSKSLGECTLTVTPKKKGSIYTETVTFTVVEDNTITIEGVKESYTVTLWSRPTVDYVVKDANGHELTYSTNYTAKLTNGDGVTSLNFAPGTTINTKSLGECVLTVGIKGLPDTSASFTVVEDNTITIEGVKAQYILGETLNYTLKDANETSVTNNYVANYESGTTLNTEGTFELRITNKGTLYGSASFEVSKPTSIDITMNGAGIMTYSSEWPMDFSDMTKDEGTQLTAYLVAGYNSETHAIVLTPLTDVPACTGLLLKGTPGKTFTVGVKNTSMVLCQLLVAVTSAETIVPQTEGDMTNYILANGSYGIDWYTLSQDGSIGANKAYLQLPTSANSARPLTWIYEDETTSLREISNEELEISNYDYYTLDGRRIANGQKPTAKGIYIVNGKKVVIK